MATLDAAAIESPLLSVRSLVQEYHTAGGFGRRGGVVHAVADVSFDVGRGETVGIVGETGCGKSTLAKAIVQAPPPRSGCVLLNDQDLTRLKRKDLRAARRNVQMVFQDPYSSLDPRWRIIDQVAEPLRIHDLCGPDERGRRASELMTLVGLDPARVGPRRPREVSGGECQRVVMARALTMSPELIILDEPVSSMDVSVQAQVLNLLERLRRELNLSYVFISHDLGVVKHVSDRVIVMFLGRFCEVAPAEELYSAPFHPYSSELVTSIPNPRAPAVRQRRDELGEPPSPLNPPSGCRFRTRCPRAQGLCAEVEPQLRPVGPGHAVACHFPLRAVGDGASMEAISSADQQGRNLDDE